ncbi:hypothetical protein GVN18_40600 [Pseudomonas sp. ODNR1LW]|nr:hypothetical protein [Pseudomonas sp. ODNR1LW]
MAAAAKREGRIFPLRLIGWGFVALVLLAPLVAMRFTREVNWTGSDFLIAGVLLVGGGALIELALAVVKRRSLALALCAAVVLAVLMVWADGAVGLF